MSTTSGETRYVAYCLTIEEIALVFDGSPGPKAPRFIETETVVADRASGRGVGVGRWVDNTDGTWSLIIRVPSEDVRRD